MRYVIISDIHSNLESLLTFITKILPELQADKIICLGDIVGYNADPVACMDIVLDELHAVTIRGNHDRAVATGDFEGFSEKALSAGKWTRKKLDHKKVDTLNRIEKGPLFIGDGIAVCHGAATDEDKYILTAHHAMEEFEWMRKNNQRVLFFGHTHIQKIFRMTEKSNIVTSIDRVAVDINKNAMYVINPGSIGQPRDRNPKPGFALFDTETMNVRLYRYSYAIQNAQRKILETRMMHAEELAARLAYGV